MGGLSSEFFWIFAAIGLAFHCATVALAQALRTYSRSRLEDVCEANGRPDRADMIARNDEATEQAAGVLSAVTIGVLTALLGISLAGIVTDQAESFRANPALKLAWNTELQIDVVVLATVLFAAVAHLFAGVFGRVFAERVIDGLWPLARPLRTLAKPLTLISTGIEYLVARFGSERETTRRPSSVEVEIHSSDEDEEEVEADLAEPTRLMLERVLDLSRRDVSEIMTPRSSIIALPATVSAAEAAKVFQHTGRSRIPLFGENRDDIIGILYAKDLFAAIIESVENLEPRSLSRAPYCVPETMQATALLEELRARRIQIAIVVDEYGGVVGLITLEDLLEELVGTIDDEHDIPTPEDPLIPLGGSTYEVDATITLEDLNDRLDLDLPTDGDFQTVGGYAFTLLGRLPEPGESFRANGVEFTVLEVVDHSIRRLKLDLQPIALPTGN